MEGVGGCETMEEVGESPIQQTSSQCSVPGIMLAPWGLECRGQYPWKEEVPGLLGRVEGYADIFTNHAITLVS